MKLVATALLAFGLLSSAAQAGYYDGYPRWAQEALEAK
jgi:hypothetical protein